MGQNQSCSQLNEFGNACEMHNCIEKVVGLKSNSTSPTDTWILTFKDDTKYEDTVINKGFLKFFIDPSTLPDYYTRLPTLKGLVYEIRVYKDVIRPLVDLKICPNFIRYLGSATSCSYDSMIKILENNTYLGDTPMLKQKDALEQSFQDNFNHMYRVKGGRNSINTELPPNLQPIEDAKNHKYSLLVNETIKQDTYTLGDFLNMIAKTGKKLERGEWCIIFQVIIACYAMSSAKMGHNDLHPGNIYIEPYSKRLNYILGSHMNMYSTKCGVIAKLYDFDRSYSNRLGNNPLLEPESGLGKYSQTNEFIPNRDMVKILGYVYTAVGYEDKLKILGIVSKIEGVDLLKKVYSSSNFLRNPDNNNNPLTPQEYEFNFNTAEEIMSNIGSHTNSKIRNNQDITSVLMDIDNLYICVPQFFGSDGKIIGHSIAKQFAYYHQKRELSRQYKKDLSIYSQKDAEIVTLKNEADKLNAENSTLNQMVQDLETRIGMYEREMIELRNQNKQLTDEITLLSVTLMNDDM